MWTQRRSNVAILMGRDTRMRLPSRRASAIQEVVPGVFTLVNPWGSNVYLLDGPRLTIIDAGFPLDARGLAARARGLDPLGPQMMVATHCHLDHMGSMSRLKKAFGSSVAAHVADADVMEGSKPYTIYKLDPVRAVYYKLLGPLYPYEHVAVDVRLEEGDTVDVMGGMRVVHVPGHTDGSIALHQADRGILFSGDTIRNEGGVLDGPPPQFTDDIDLAYEGIAEKLVPLGFDVLLPGHGEPVTGGAWERVEKMVEERKRRA